MKNQLAHEIQQLAKKLLVSDTDFDTSEMKKNIAILYEKISVLDYLTVQKDKSTLPEQTAMDSKAFREQNWFKEPEPVPQSTHQDDLVEPLIEKIKDLVAQMPAESQKVDAMLEEILPAKKYIKNDLEDFAAQYQQMPTFKRKEMGDKEEEIDTSAPQPTTQTSSETPPPSSRARLIKDQESSEKPKSINDIANKSLKVGLNDRLAFVKHLFDDSTDDFQRVLSQINTFEDFPQASQFIENQVRPEYPQWDEKEDVVTRFMTLVEKRFM